MSIKIQYNKQLLEKLCVRDECIVDFRKIKIYNRDIKVDFICKCGNTHNKTFRTINNIGGFCKICTNNNKQKNEYQEKQKEYREQNKCEHNRQKTRCKDCRGKSICEHNRQKSGCKDCGGSQICSHNRRKIQCKECGGGSICIHNRIRSQCKECGGGSICPHNRIKSKCKECGGGSICPHNRIKSTCKECKGASICEHNRQKSTCKECGGSSLCKSSWCHTRAIPKYNGYCLNCCINICPDIQVSRNYKTKEKEVVDRIKEKYPDFTWIHDKKVVDGCSKRRPDLLLDMGYHIIIVEVDENKHTGYDCSCENKRLMELSQDLQHRPIVFIRFNPDSYINQNKLKISSCWRTNKQGVIQIMKTRMTEWKERINILNQQIQYWIDNKSNKTIEIIELFYDNYL
jgi:hypothetical protein